MKKKLIIALAACMTILAVSLFGCGDGDKYADSEYCGTWSAETAEYSGISLDATSIFDQFDLTLEPSGKATVEAAIGGETQSGSGEWEPTENGISLKDSGLDDEALELTDQDGKLAMEYQGMTVIFKKA